MLLHKNAQIDADADVEQNGPNNVQSSTEERKLNTNPSVPSLNHQPSVQEIKRAQSIEDESVAFFNACSKKQ